MPGPLGPTGPTTDPNWAWDTPGWTNQSNTGDTEGTNNAPASLGSNTYLTEPEALSGFVARSMDPAVNSAQSSTKATFTNQVIYVAAMEVLAPAVTSKFVVSVGTIGGTSTSYFGLYSAVGTQMATIAVVNNIPATTISRSWTTAAVLAPGTYYFAWLNATAASGAVPYATAQTSEQTLLSGTTFPGSTFRFFSTGSGASTLPASLATGFTGAGTCASFTSSWFAGIA